MKNLEQIFKEVLIEAEEKIRCTVCGKKFSKDSGRKVGGTHDFQCNSCQNYIKNDLKNKRK